MVKKETLFQKIVDGRTHVEVNYTYVLGDVNVSIFENFSLHTVGSRTQFSVA